MPDTPHWVGIGRQGDTCIPSCPLLAEKNVYMCTVELEQQRCWNIQKPLQPPLQNSTHIELIEGALFQTNKE